MIPDNTTRTIDRANAVFARLDDRYGAAQDAAERERRRLNASLGRALGKLGIATGLVGIPTVYIDLVVAPLGLLGWVAAASIGAGVAALLMRVGGREIAAPNLKTDLPNKEMVQQFDSYLFRARRALPTSARAQIDLISAQLPLLTQVLERAPDLDLTAQDARRLISIHLPNLIDHYLHVPAAFRSQRDDEGFTVDARLVEALAAGRGALTDISEKLAHSDLAAFETQGRFIQARYAGDNRRIELSSAEHRPDDPKV